MGVYKVIQDIEAEDKLLGPLTLKQFIFAIVGVLFYYLSFLVVSKHATFMLAIFLPPALIATFFAWPWSADQPTEVWALAKIRFFFKPRTRVWNQSGQKELVTITVPKRVAEPMRTNGLSQGEVNSRLGALANTIDSRGWAIKNSAINLTVQPAMASAGSDRLLSPGNFPQEVPNYDITDSDDILDEQNNPIAQQFDQMITASSQAHRQQLVQMMQQPQQAPGMSLPAPISSLPTVALPAPQAAAPTPDGGSRYWFMNRPGRMAKRSNATEPAIGMAAPAAPMALPVAAVPMAPAALPATQFAGIPQAAVPTADEEALGRQFKAEHDRPEVYSSNMKTIQPLGPAPSDDTPVVTDDVFVPELPQLPELPAPALPQPNAALLQLAANDDLNVATLAREAHKNDESHKELGDNEVIISLH